MNKLLYIFLFFFLFLGCRKNDTPVWRTLKQAEACMNQYPDSAFRLLQTVPMVGSLYGEERAKYSLLYVQACDKLKNYVENDSLIRFAVDYYQGKGQNLDAAKSCFYLGTVFRNVNDYASAVEAYLEALKRMPEECLDKTLALIYYYLGDSYYEQDMYPEAKEAFGKANDVYLAMGDTLQTFFSLRGIANVYLLENKVDDALKYFELALELAERENNFYWMSHAYDRLSIVYCYRIGNLSVALDYIEKALAIDSLKSVLSTKGEILLRMDSLKEAKKHFILALENCTELNTKASCFLALCKLEKRLGNYKEACGYADSSYLYLDSIRMIQKSTEILKINRKFEHGILKLKMEARTKIYFYILIFMGVCIILLVIVFFLIRMNKHKKEEMEKQSLDFEFKIDTINKFVEDKLGATLSAQDSIMLYEKEKMQNCITAFSKTEWYERLNIITPEQLRLKYLEDGEQMRLFEVLDTIFVDYIYRLRKKYPKINDIDIYFCILSILGYKNRNISYCLKLSLDALRNRKSRLKKYMLDSDFLEIFG